MASVNYGLTDKVVVPLSSVGTGEAKKPYEEKPEEEEKSEECSGRSRHVPEVQQTAAPVSSSVKRLING